MGSAELTWNSANPTSGFGCGHSWQKSSSFSQFLYPCLKMSAHNKLPVQKRNGSPRQKKQRRNTVCPFGLLTIWVSLLQPARSLWKLMLAGKAKLEAHRAMGYGRTAAPAPEPGSATSAELSIPTLCMLCQKLRKEWWGSEWCGPF